MALGNFLVDTNWLQANIKRQHVRVLDATWCLPKDENERPRGVIPGAQFFDIDRIASPHPFLKHMLPSAEHFLDANLEMGINDQDWVVCYDRLGVFSAPRVWWTYRMFGHANVFVLNGGLPEWLKMGGNVEPTYRTDNSRKTSYKPQPALTGVIGFDEIVSILDMNPQIVDARPSGRFYGTDPEPRAGLRSGRIPGSLSLPYGTLIRDGHYKSSNEIAELVGRSGVDLSKPIITTCGSGITAAGLAFVFHGLGAEDVRVYDGSWAEYGASDAPIESGHER